MCVGNEFTEGLDMKRLLKKMEENYVRFAALHRYLEIIGENTRQAQ